MIDHSELDEKLSKLESKLENLLLRNIAHLEDKYGRALHDIQYGNQLNEIDDRVGALESRADATDAKEQLFEVSKLDTVKALCRLKKTEDRIEELSGVVMSHFVSKEAKP